jgi:Tfp pilus assembly protein PilO
MHNATVQRLIRDIPIIAYFCAVCLLCCAALRYAAFPRWVAYNESLERIKYYDKYISSSGGFDEIRQRLEFVNERLRVKRSGILMENPSRTLPDILQTLIRRGNDCGVVLTKIQPRPETGPANSKYVPVFLETAADYHNLGKYIAALEALPHILQIRRFSIELTRDGELNAKLLVNCLIAANGDGRQIPENAASVKDITSIYDVFALADSALNTEIIIPAAAAVSEVNSPFRTFGARPVTGFTRVAAAAPPAKHERSHIKLKGLMKNPPLAIIEDARGQTHIKAQGEFIQNAQIIAINSNSVIFRDSSGTHELKVEENR